MSNFIYTPSPYVTELKNLLPLSCGRNFWIAPYKRKWIGRAMIFLKLNCFKNGTKLSRTDCLFFPTIFILPMVET